MSIVCRRLSNVVLFSSKITEAIIMMMEKNTSKVFLKLVKAPVSLKILYPANAEAIKDTEVWGLTKSQYIAFTKILVS